MMTNRLMDIPEFQKYAGGIGRSTALRISKEAGVRVKIGKRVLVDRLKFDRWIEENVK